MGGRLDDAMQENENQYDAIQEDVSNLDAAMEEEIEDRVSANARIAEASMGQRGARIPPCPLLSGYAGRAGSLGIHRRNVPTERVALAMASGPWRTRRATETS